MDDILNDKVEKNILIINSQKYKNIQNLVIEN